MIIVDAEHHPLNRTVVEAVCQAHQWCLPGQASQEPLSDRVELTDVAEGVNERRNDPNLAGV